MNLPAHYDAMRAAALHRLAHGTAELDLLLDSPLDARRGITLLARPPAPILAAIEALLADFRQAEPSQYYYPQADIHLTILSIISCYPGFELSQVDPAAYRQVVGAVLAHTAPFTITFAGLTASPGGILVQGFMEDDGLAQLRENLRLAFRAAGLQQSIDQRYSIQTAHATLIRFRHQLRQPGRLIALLHKYQHHAIGAFEVTAVELVFNDWYQRAAATVLLQRYPLAAGHQGPS